MRFAGQVGKKKKNREAFWTRFGFVFLFSQVVMVTTAAGHFRTASLASKESPRLGVIQDPRMGILRHINTQKEAVGHRVERG